ncbi:YhgE/Pip N-terminal domain-containing protein [Paenibacillus sp. UNC496MF]|uniref:YhgE/Pip domain-containing protein n=1 Tax=Paenibacillus sp. UNC496MF TaxID=1502753 RepID=UPI0008EA2009|nr:ABC transporter permease [Paenibacillus sp. UNC496MF]SFJ33338.1 YhgE/Pip N-terminal domain-containing protein [Paenibacillus sp. UNC496MF]
MIRFFRQRHPYLTVFLVFLVVLVLGLAQLGSSVNPVPRDLPVLLVQGDAGSMTPAGDTNFGRDLSERLRNAVPPGGEGPALVWRVVASEEAAVKAMNREEAYAALVIPADFSKKLSSLLSPDPRSASAVLYVNQGMNYNGATMASGIVTQMLGGANAQLRDRLLAKSGPGGTLTPAQTDALAEPIRVTSRSINAIGPNSSNGSAPVVLTQLVWFAAMVSTMMLFVAANRATANGFRLHRFGIRVSQILMGIAASGAAALSILWIAGQWFGLHIPDYAGIGWYLFFVCFVFFLVQTTVVSWLGFAGMPLFILLFFFAAPLLALPPELLPAFSRRFVYDWLPLRFAAEGLRDLFYFRGLNLDGPTWTLAAIGGVGVVLIPLSVLKRHRSADNEMENQLPAADVPGDFSPVEASRPLAQPAFAEAAAHADLPIKDSEFRHAIREFLTPSPQAIADGHFSDNEYRKALLKLKDAMNKETDRYEEMSPDQAYRQTLKQLTGRLKEPE